MFFRLLAVVAALTACVHAEDRSPHTVLGVSSNAAPVEDVARAFRTMTAIFEGYARVDDASNAAAMLGNAFDVLTDPVARQAIVDGSSIDAALALIAPPNDTAPPTALSTQADIDQVLAEAGEAPVLLWACDIATGVITRARRRIVALHGKSTRLHCVPSSLLHDVDVELYERGALVGALPLGGGAVVTTDDITDVSINFVCVCGRDVLARCDRP